MNLLRVFTLALLGAVWPALISHAQSTNLPPTDIGQLESQTNVVIVKGFGTGGTVSAGGGVITVHLKESYIPGSSSRLRGLVLEYNDGPYRHRAVVDYTEIESLLNGLDFIRSATYDVTGLPGFEADYRTKDGFRVIGLGSHRQSSVQTFIAFEDSPRILLDSDQMSQLRAIISQARTSLDELKEAK